MSFPNLMRINVFLALPAILTSLPALYLGSNDQRKFITNETTNKMLRGTVVAAHLVTYLNPLIALYSLHKNKWHFSATAREVAEFSSTTVAEGAYIYLATTLTSASLFVLSEVWQRFRENASR